MTVERVKQELKRLRKGAALAHPAAVLHLSPQLRAVLARRRAPRGDADDVVDVLAGLRQAVDELNEHQRRFAVVDLNLDPDHSFPTLTGRQESLAYERACASKTVRRHADQALDSLAFALVSEPRLDRRDPRPPTAHQIPTSDQVGTAPWRDALRAFWRVVQHGRVDIVCSEIPEDERPEFASPQDRNYLRYAKFADLDSLILVRTRLMQLGIDVHVRDFAPSEYHDSDTDILVVIGGPPWNTKYREFLPQLPYYFEPHLPGQDDPLVVPGLDDLTLGPRWSKDQDLLEDLAVFTRLTLSQGPTVFLLGGCLTLGVLGAARCFLQGERGADNARYITDLVGDADMVAVTEARRVGGIADVADLTRINPLLVLARDDNDPFSVVVDNTARYTA